MTLPFVSYHLAAPMVLTGRSGTVCSLWHYGDVWWQKTSHGAYGKPQESQKVTPDILEEGHVYRWWKGMHHSKSSS